MSEDVKNAAEALDKIATAFEQYKQVNDDRIEAIRKGLPAGDFEAKLSRIDQHIEGLNEAKGRLEKIEAKLARPGYGATKDGEKQTPEAEAYKGAFLNWVRNPGDPERRMALQQRSKDLQKVQSRAAKDDEGFETRSTQTVTTTGSAPS
jgi:hypothetical protein